MSISSVFNYYKFCALQPTDYVGCELFWLAWIGSAEVFLIIFCYYKIKNIFVERRQIREYHQRMANRQKVAEPEVMEKHIWHGE